MKYRGKSSGHASPQSTSCQTLILIYLILLGLSPIRCQIPTNTPYWHETENWSRCSTTCGPGIQRKEFLCVTRDMYDVITVIGNDACAGLPAPKSTNEEPVERACNLGVCRGYRWRTSNWGHCSQTCGGFGTMSRDVECVYTGADGDIVVLEQNAAYYCGHAFKAIPVDLDARSVEFHAKILNLQVGQRAFVIPFTRLTVLCPVHYFSVHDIIWNHPNHGELRYTGSSKERVTVDKRGRLRIRSFRSMDAGEWQCNAGSRHAEVSFIPRTPAEGFHDWVQRNRLWTKGMMSDDPKDLAAVHAIVQWVEGPWSACSVACGDAGQQFRTVRCERVDTRFYQILDDQACLDKLLPKPLSKRKCIKSKKCPAWVVEGADSSVCSRLCGGVGVKARQLTCVWVHDKQPAGPLCYANQLPIPPVIEECEAPPCKFVASNFEAFCIPSDLETSNDL
ncbi:uncharacterized protein DEA37_0010082 [Paragonimus westermani]|uniref:Ig-like domain-containing protein n=1 Tax=Paragonimus westermani TaxID=34504 RepID=A0A5J4P2P9_9TREM|nr:uncharacterized protein DEA37_0010082 [Paragonimus westermani]